MLLKPRDMVRVTESSRSGLKTLLWVTSDAVSRIDSANTNDVLVHTTFDPTARGVAVGLETPLTTDVGDVNLLTVVSDEELARDAAAFEMARGSFSNYRAAVLAARGRTYETSSRVISLCHDTPTRVIGRIHFNKATWNRITETDHLRESGGKSLTNLRVSEFKHDVERITGKSLDDWTEVGATEGSSVLDLFRSAWTLYNSPEEMNITATTHTALSSGSRSSKNRNKAVHNVDVIDVRRSTSRDRNDASGTSRDHDHRWTVRGHWRNQTCGSGGELRRKTWIEEHVRGPEDMPLVVRPKVWRI